MSRCSICDQKLMNCDCTSEERRMHEELENIQEEMDIKILEAERRGELAGWNAARERIVDPKHFGAFITGDPVTKLAYDTFTDWRNSEEYKKGKAEVEG